MTLDIVGGTYYEICIEPGWYELYGSGLRAAHSLSGRQASIILHTCIGTDYKDELKCICDAIKVDVQATILDKTYSFTYYHPLADPYFTVPLPATLPVVSTSNCLQFGALEGNSVVHADKVVYDPQSPGNPLSFWNNGSTTNTLIWVANFTEAQNFTGQFNLDEIKKYLFEVEKVSAAIIKKGSDGAILLQPEKEDFYIPLFMTKTVWPIGTGDIFTSSFAYNYLINSLSLEESAISASLATAYYTETVSLPIPEHLETSKFKQFQRNLHSTKKIYLAGPFFTMAERWLVGQFRQHLLSFGLDVFSPYHDVGYGNAEKVVPLDIEAIENSDIVVAIVDGLDSGTLFEIGYAKALNLPVIAFVENEKEEDLTMLRGVNCLIVKDFSTAIYKTVWEAYKL